jgi:TPR repeat protein
MKIDEKMLNDAYSAFESDDYAAARSLFDELVKNGNLRAHLYLGWIYDQGLGVSVDLIKAEYHYKILSESNDADGKYYLASLLHRQKKMLDAISLYEQAADLGHVSAAYWAYSLNSTHSSEVEIINKSNYYLMHAAKLGHMFAQRDLELKSLKNEKNIFKKIKMYIHFNFLKMQGFLLIFKNSQDMRIR